MTNQQVGNYLAQGRSGFRLDQIELSRTGTQPAIDWLKSQDLSDGPMIYATADTESVKAAQSSLGVAKAGQIVEQALAACAVAARDLGVRQFVVATFFTDAFARLEA